MKKKILCLFTAILLVGCTNSAKQSYVTTTSEPVTSNLVNEYEQLSEDNSFYILEKNALQTFIEHGTGILYLSFPECPWCQAYIPQLNTVLQEVGIEAGYYNIHTDKTEDREFYDLIASTIESVNDTGSSIIQYDNDGKQVIYMPLVLFIDGGRIVGMNNETCMEDSKVIQPSDYWTEEKKTALKEELTGNAQAILEKQQENDAKGCDTGCKID